MKLRLGLVGVELPDICSVVGEADERVEGATGFGEGGLLFGRGEEAEERVGEDGAMKEPRIGGGSETD